MFKSLNLSSFYPFIIKNRYKYTNFLETNHFAAACPDFSGNVRRRRAKSKERRAESKNSKSKKSKV